MSQLLIDSNYVKSITTVDGVPNTIKSLIKTPDLMKLLYKKFSSDNDILPNNCRYVEGRPDGRKIFVIEEEPKIRTISVGSDLNGIVEKHKANGKYEEYGLEKFNPDKNRNMFSLSFPYIIYVILLHDDNRFSSMMTFFRIHPFSSLNDYLLIPSLPNINNSYSVCLGEFNYRCTGSPSESINEILKGFWGNSFNYDYYDNFRMYENNPELCDYFTWSYNTKKDPLFIFSTNWIPTSVRGTYNTLDEALDDFRLSNSDNNSGLLSTMIQLTSENRDEDNTYENPTFERRFFTESIALPNGTILSIGDEVIRHDETYYIYSFVSSRNGIEKIKLEDSNGKIKELVFNAENKKLLETQYKKPEILEVEINGDVFKKDDIVQFENSCCLKSIDRIVKNRDNTFQIQMGKEFYLPQAFTTNKIQKFDKDNITFCGVKLEVDKAYYVKFLDDSDGIFIKYDLVIFKNISSANSTMILNFRFPNDKLLQISYLKKGYELMSEDSILPRPQVFRVNGRLFTNIPDSRWEISILKGSGLAISNNIEKLTYVSMHDSKKILGYRKDICMQYFSKIKDEISIPSYDFDLSYKIGEELIYVDWKVPEEMLKIRTLHSFSTTENHLSFNLIDDSKNVISVPFIDFNTGIVNEGMFRKVCREINNIKVGFKAVVNSTGVSDFPKKDCNEIKAFIIDTKEPLVLFSNFRTMFLSDLEMFNLFSPEDKKYSKLIVSSVNDKIKHQEGDYINLVGNSEVYILSKERSRMFAYCVDFYTGGRSVEVTVMTKSSRHGLLMPRYSEKQLLTLPYKRGIAGIKNYFTKSVNGSRNLEVRTDSRG